MSEADKMGSSFWSTLENILRPQQAKHAVQNETEKSFDQRTLNKNSECSNQENSTDEIYKRLNGLKETESLENRIKSFEDLIKLSELFYLNENILNNLLKLTSDLFKIEQTPIEFRVKAFECLIQFYQKKLDKFDTFMLRNHLLCFIIINSKTSKCIFLNSLNQMKSPMNNLKLDGLSTNNSNSLLLNNIQNSQSKTSANNKSLVEKDEIKLRFVLFLLVTKNGNYCKNLDPDLLSECLVYFLENCESISDRCQEIFELFLNILSNKFFQYINENILSILTRYMLNFSFHITKSVYHETYKPLTRQQQQDINLCVKLIDKVIENLTTSICINYVVLCLCELLDITWQNQLNRSDIQINRIDSQMIIINESIIAQIYECMNKLFVSPIGNCAIFTFFTEIFPTNKKYQVHRKHQINGALMHIKQIFDDFKQSKLRNSYLIKELHINCLIYLPNALKSCYSSDSKEQQLLMLENILNLTIDLVNLASHKDLFMCLLTYKSRKFLIEIVNQFSTQKFENESLIRKYADLLNLLDLKDVFTYKTSNKENLNQSNSNQSLLRNASTASLNKENIDESTLIFLKFKESFYDLVYKFPPASNYLKDNCINNCIEFYLQRKFLPIYGSVSINGIKELLEKYLSIKNQFNINVRRYVVDALHRKIKEYFNIDQKSFVEQLVKEVVLNTYETTLVEDDSNYRNNSDKSNVLIDLFEMKYFLILKLIDLIHLCQDEENNYKIIKIFDKVMCMERVSSVELLVPHNIIALSAQNQLVLINQSQSNCLNYLYKIIINGLMEIFEKYFSKKFTKCIIEIFNILVKYLEYYYLTQYSFNNAMMINSNNPSSLMSIAAESLPMHSQWQAQTSPKFYNYYSTIRKEIFEFLLRIRSNRNNKVMLINRVNRRKSTESKYLMLNICETYDEAFEKKDENIKLFKCEIDFGKILKLIEYCLDKEYDWNVITKVLSELPYVMQYEMDLIQKSDFTYKIFNLLNRKDISVIRNKPDTITKQDYTSKFYPLIASLISYHHMLEKSSQENILQNIALAIHSFKNLYCLEILTIAMSEMYETNAIQCGDILLKLSQVSSSSNMAQPILELLSTISDFKKLHSFCGIKEFIAVSATAIKYIDPFKFNAFIVLFAHYVLCIWFIKCKPEFRKSYANFTSRGLYQEVIMQLESKNTRENKSPNKMGDNESSGLNSSQKRMSTVEPLQNQNDSGVKSSSSESSISTKNVLSENMKQFYRDLVEITMDFMSNNMSYDSSLNNQTSSAHNRGEFVVDRFSNNGNMIGVNQSSLFDTKETKKNGQQTKLWLVGNRIIQITTGLFSNICLDDPSNLITRKSKSSKPNNFTSKPRGIHSQAIDIPSQINTDSVASSNNSSASISINNSFSSMSSNLIDGKKGESSNYGKSEQDFFEETINADDENDSLKRALMQQQQQQSIEEGVSSKQIHDYGMTKRNKYPKRRYKSGLPLTNDNDDSVEENYLKNFGNDNSKVSKDDSVLNNDSEVLPFCCIKNNNHRHHHHHHHSHRYHELKKNNLDGTTDVKELCNPNCWCNHLVEIKCRYPTKVTTFVSIIEPNFSNSHAINLSSFEKFIKANPLQLNFKSDEIEIMKEVDKSLTRETFLINQTNAIENRRTHTLSRISESSVVQDTPPQTIDKILELEKIPEINEKKLADLSNTEKRLNTPRKSSFDFTSDTSSTDSRLFSSTNNFMRSLSVNQKSSQIQDLNNHEKPIDPSQVFLHLFRNQNFFNEKDKPVLVPENDNIKRSLDILDYYACFWLHKIGVIYVGPNQANDETAILSNTNGSIRYRNFVNGLGNLIYLRDTDSNQYYLGSLDTDGTAGDFAVLWYDGIIQILFHIATMMKTEENTISKKRHIGNDSTIIVYNESGEEYNFNMIKGDVNCVCIEIIPLKTNTNIVRVKTTNEMSQWLNHSNPKFISDQNLSLICRKMALHADMASKVCRTQKDSVNGNIYGGRFYDRLKQINRIRKLTKDSTQKQSQQQQQQNQQQQNKQNDFRSTFSFNISSDSKQSPSEFFDFI
ncbi:unnamed protein product [Brachionus calyciflorus]|uniref:Rap-GAP domain-containing protein n=1 Tax=Brachionus calyciflorus TaxID=104777 RepID=A0A813WXZ6_9BILA|nr:unnamed protein product [Brachionus calyciflorus]